MKIEFLYEIFCICKGYYSFGANEDYLFLNFKHRSNSFCNMLNCFSNIGTLIISGLLNTHKITTKNWGHENIYINSYWKKTLSNILKLKITHKSKQKRTHTATTKEKNTLRRLWTHEKSRAQEKGSKKH